MPLTTRAPWPRYGPNGSNDVAWSTMLELLFDSWTAPAIPTHISFHLSTAILTAWECIRKASLIYLWRGGFDANALTPLTANRKPNTSRNTNTAARWSNYLRQLLHGIASLLDLAERDIITIANAMLWPLVVIGNECCAEPETGTGRGTGMRAEVLRLLTRARRYFSITHFEHVITLLRELWRRADAVKEDTERETRSGGGGGSKGSPPAYGAGASWEQPLRPGHNLNLQSLARDLELCVPLF
ncbi:hypothetical protein BDV06DRAFT_222994 [Aspergillus oleicola]